MVFTLVWFVFWFVLALGIQRAWCWEIGQHSLIKGFRYGTFLDVLLIAFFNFLATLYTAHKRASLLPERKQSLVSLLKT